MVWIISVLALLILIWKYYWRIQLSFNTSVLSTITPDTFTLSESYKDAWERRVNNGFEMMGDSTLTIAALLRDVESTLPEIIKKVEKLGSRFANYKVLIVENDSIDQTRKALLRWAKKNPRVTILGCGVNASNCFLNLSKTDGHSVYRKRISKMVDLRNLYLDYIREKFTGGGAKDFLVVWDLDAKAAIYHDGIANSFGYFKENPNVSSICANGIYRWGAFTLFYDTYALLDKGETFDIQDKWKHDLRKGIRGMSWSRGQEPIEVDSCFSGFTIYRMNAVMGDQYSVPKYQLTPEPNLECEHVSFARSLPGKKVINPSMIHLILKNE